jgi:chromosome segregation ATPase
MQFRHELNEKHRFTQDIARLKGKFETIRSNIEIDELISNQLVNDRNTENLCNESIKKVEFITAAKHDLVNEVKIINSEIVSIEEIIFKAETIKRTNIDKSLEEAEILFEKSEEELEKQKNLLLNLESKFKGLEDELFDFQNKKEDCLQNKTEAHIEYKKLTNEMLTITTEITEIKKTVEIQENRLNEINTVNSDLELKNKINIDELQEKINKNTEIINALNQNLDEKQFEILNLEKTLQDIQENYNIQSIDNVNNQNQKLQLLEIQLTNLKSNLLAVETEINSENIRNNTNKNLNFFDKSELLLSEINEIKKNVDGVTYEIENIQNQVYYSFIFYLIFVLFFEFFVK